MSATQHHYLLNISYTLVAIILALNFSLQILDNKHSTKYRHHGQKKNHGCNLLRSKLTIRNTGVNGGFFFILSENDMYVKVLTLLLSFIINRWLLLIEML